jgi:uncharacterized protein
VGMVRAWVSFLLLALFVVPAAAVDCSASVAERAVCNDPELTAEFDAMRVALDTALGGLSPEAEELVMSGQRRWMLHVNAICGDDVQCIGREVGNNLVVLEGSRSVGGIRFYPVTEYASLPDPDYEPDSIWAWAKHSTAVVRIDGGPDADAFAEAMAAVEAEFGTFIGTAQGAVPDMEDAFSDTNVSVIISEVKGQRITAQVQSDSYPHGAAHGSYIIEQLHYLRDQRRMMRAGDVFAAKNWNSQLAQLVWDVISGNGQLAEGWLDGPEDLIEAVADPRRWSFEQDRLVIRFHIYDIGPYSGGSQIVGIPWTALEPLLAEGHYRYTSAYL